MSRISKHPDIRRQELLNIGADLYFKSGEKGITIQQVVDRANVATGLFYYYFKSKEQFLEEALNSYIEKRLLSFESIFQKDYSSLEDKLNCILDEYFKYVTEMDSYRFHKIFHTDHHYAFTNKLITKMKKPVSDFLAQGVNDGVFNVKQIDLATDFILNGLSSVFDLKNEIGEDTFYELKTYIVRILMMK